MDRLWNELLFTIFGITRWAVVLYLVWLVFMRPRKRAREESERLKKSLLEIQADLSELKARVSEPQRQFIDATPTRVVETAPSAESEIETLVEDVQEDVEATEPEVAKPTDTPAVGTLPSLVVETPEEPAEAEMPAKVEEKEAPVESEKLPAGTGRIAAAVVESDQGPEPLISGEVKVTFAHAVAPPPEERDEDEAAPADDEVSPARKSRLNQLPAPLLKAAVGGDQGDADWETRIGRGWLNIIGIVVLVVGLVLLIQQTLLYLGPGAKIALGLVVSLLLIGAGLFQERRETYRVFARTLVGGGWALLYFTAYAAYNIDAAKIIDDGTVALAALLATAAAIIIHSFVYRSQFVTGLAYGLGFLALHLSPISFYSLVAVAILAGSILFVIRFTDWRMIGLLTVVSTYGTHARWLWETEIARELGTTEILLSGLPPQAAFWANMALLSVYWVIFCTAALVRPVTEGRARLLDLGTSVLNMVGLLSMCAWQMTEHVPGNMHFLAATATIAFAVIAIVDRAQKRPLLSQFNGSVAVVLYAIALPMALRPENLSADWLAPYWAVGSAFIWFVGQRIGRTLYRYEAYAIALLALDAAFLNNYSGRMIDHDPTLWYAALTTLLLFEGFAEILRKEREIATLTKNEVNFGLLTVPASAALIGVERGVS